MFHYLADAWRGHRGEETHFSSSTPSAAADEARTQLAKEEELLMERREAYRVFMTETSLGQCLAPHLPSADRVCILLLHTAKPDNSGTEHRSTSSPSEDKQQVADSEKSTEPMGLELTLYETLSSTLSQETLFMAQRVLPLVVPPPTTASAASNEGFTGVAGCSQPESPSLSPVGGRVPETAAKSPLPLFLTVVLLHRWQASLYALRIGSWLEMDSRPVNGASSPAGGVTKFEYVLKGLQQLSHVLVALSSLTEAYGDSMREHYQALGAATASCVTETLKCLRRLVWWRSAHELTTSTTADAVTTSSTDGTSLKDAAGSSARGRGPQPDHHSECTGVSEAVEALASSLISFLLYWMHLAQGLSPPHLATMKLFLTTSYAMNSASRAEEKKPSSSSASLSQVDHRLDRCTGLTNAALLNPMHVDALLGSPLDQGDSSSGAGDTSMKIYCAVPFFVFCTDEVSHALVALLLAASKGVVPNVPPSSGAPLSSADAVSSDDDDLGLLVVLTSRLLWCTLGLGASALPDCVITVTGPLLGALSILLARFIAADQEEATRDEAQWLAGGSTRLGLPQHPEQRVRSDLTTDGNSPPPSFSGAPGDSINATGSPVPYAPQCASSSSSPGGECRLLRLIGQISCGLVLLKALLQHDAFSVLDAMDHSFFLDALVTSLQVMGRRYIEPSEQQCQSFSGEDRVGDPSQAPDAWSVWVQAVNSVTQQGCDGEVEGGDCCPLTPDGRAAGKMGLCLWPSAVRRLSEHTFAVLARSGFVDEFLHSYMGLLALGRLVRASPFALAPPNSLRDTPLSVATSSSPAGRSSASGTMPRGVSRALLTLDQLELTLIKTFSTVYEASLCSDALAGAKASTHGTEWEMCSLHEKWSKKPEDDVSSTRGMRDSHAEKDEEVQQAAFPHNSCIYNLLLKHVLWCCSTASKLCSERLGLHPLQTDALPQRQTIGSHFPSSASSTVRQLSPGLSPSVVAATPLWTGPANPAQLTLAPSSLPPVSPLTTALRCSSSPPAANASESADDVMLSFLVRSGLMEIVLHEDSFSADLTVTTGQVGQPSDARPGSLCRAHVLLYILSYCLRLRLAADEIHSDGNDTLSSASSKVSNANDVSPPCTRSVKEANLSADKEYLACRTAEVMLNFLCTQSVDAKRPRLAAIDKRRVWWRHCLLALLTAASAVRSERSGGRSTAIAIQSCPGGLTCGTAAPWGMIAEAAPLVNAALVDAGAAEFFLRSAVATVDADPSADWSGCVSSVWYLRAVHSLATHPAARVYMATNCAPSFLPILLWHPALRSDGERLLHALLSQPVVGVCPWMRKGSDTLDSSLSATLAGSPDSVGSGDGIGAATSTQIAPRHCRKLCQTVWQLLCVGVNEAGLTRKTERQETMATSPEEMSCVPRASEEERALVTRSVLSALARALQTLYASQQDSDGECCGELLPLRLLQGALYESSKSEGRHVFALFTHHIAYLSASITKPASAAGHGIPSPDDAAASQARHSSFLISVPELTSPCDPEPSMAVSDSATLPLRVARETVYLIIKLFAGLTKANPLLREVLYRSTTDQENLVDSLASLCSAIKETGRCHPPTTPLVNSSEPLRSPMWELTRLVLYMAYEEVDSVDDFLDRQIGDAGEYMRQATGNYSVEASDISRGLSWSLQNPTILAVLLRRYARLAPLEPKQQAPLRVLLFSLISTVKVCYASLYLASSTVVHDALVQLLPVVAHLRYTAGPQSISLPMRGRGIWATPLDALLVHLLASLARCHIDVRQLKQLLMLVIHARHQRDRKAILPLVWQVLSESALLPSSAAEAADARFRDLHHALALHRSRGPAGFRAALPEFPLGGYSISLTVRWEEGPCSLNGQSQHREGRSGETWTQPDSCACIFALRTADRTTLLALMVERCTGRLFVQYRNLQQQELRAKLPASLLSREWTVLYLWHRPSNSLTAAATGQLSLSLNGEEVATASQVVYPLMSRGFFYVGCLGHEVDRLSVAHSFRGQVSLAYFFPFVLSEHDREVLRAVSSVAGVTVQSTSPSAVCNRLLLPSSSIAHRPPGVSGVAATANVAGAGQWLAERATVCMDPRLSDRGRLYNLSAILHGRTGRETRLFTLEGSLICNTQRVVESMGVLGVLSSVLMPLCTLLVNPTLPISSRGLLTDTPPVGSVHSEATTSSLPALTTSSANHAQDALTETILRVLELVRGLTSVEAIRTEMAEAGFFVFLGQMLQLLGPSLHVAVPSAFAQLLESIAPFPRLFEDALTNSFLSADVIHAAPRVVQWSWVNVQHTFLRTHQDVLPCLRTLGASMFAVTALLRVVSEENDGAALSAVEVRKADNQEDSPGDAFRPELPSSDVASPTTTLPQCLASSCSLRDLEEEWMLYFEDLSAAPVTLGDAEALQYFVENLHRTSSAEAVQLRLLRRVRRLLVASSTPFLVQLLGRKNYVVSLMPYLSSAVSESVRLEVLLQLLFIVHRSRRTQELMNPVLLASHETVVHVIEEVSLSWLKDVLQQYPVNLPVYLALRCGMLGLFEVPELPTQYAPLEALHTLRFASVLLPLLMLMKRSSDTKLKEYVLADLAVLLKSDTQAWRRVIGVRGWYVSVVGLYASSCVASPPISPYPHASPPRLDREKPVTTLGRSTLPRPCTEGFQTPLKDSEAAFTTTTMILSYTIYQVLLREAYGGTELELVVTFLREQRLHDLLHNVLCSIVDRYRSRLMPSRDDDQRGVGCRKGTGATDATGAAFIGLSSVAALANLCRFFRTVETVLFYAAPSRRREVGTLPPVHPTAAVAASSGVSWVRERDGIPHVPLRVGYNDLDDLTLVGAPDAADGDSDIAEIGVSNAGGRGDAHDDLRRSVLLDPDGCWLHLPLAVKCAELLCCHSALLHLGSNGNTGGPGTLGVGSGGGGRGRLRDTPWSALLGASAGAEVGNAVAAAAGGASGTGSGTGALPAVLPGGMLRLFGRLFHSICQMTLSAPDSLDSVVDLVDSFARSIDRDQRGTGFLLLRRAVRADEAREHSPIAICMTAIYSVHDVLLRRLRMGEGGGGLKYPNANAALVDRLKLLVELFRGSFEQLPAFTAGKRGVDSNALGSRQFSLDGAVGKGAQPVDTEGSGVGGLAAFNFFGIGTVTGDVYTAGVSTLQWLCDHQANPRRTVDAFAEVASRADYNSFLELCLLSVEREQQTNSALAPELWQEQCLLLRRLQELFRENSMSRKLVHENILSLISTRNTRIAADSGAVVSSGETSPSAQKQGGAPLAVDESTNPFTSLFLPSAARQATAASRAATWARFMTALRGTLWSPESIGMPHTVFKYVKLSLQEQQPLVHRKLLSDRDGTDYSGRAMSSLSSPSPSLSVRVSCATAADPEAELSRLQQCEGRKGDSHDTSGLPGDGGSSTPASRASRLRLRGGESVLLQVPEDDDADGEDVLLNISSGQALSHTTATSFGEDPIDALEAVSQSGKATPPPSASGTPATSNIISSSDDVSTARCVLSVACEVPFMMHCWSGSFTVRGSEVIVLIDEVNKSYNQVVAEAAVPFVARPRALSFRLSEIVQIAPGRRFRMCRTALEIWTQNRRSCFVNFADVATMEAAFLAIQSVERGRHFFAAPSFLRDGSRAAPALLPALLRNGFSGGGQCSAYVLHRNPRREPLRLRAMILWRSRLLSNFDYLLVLNMLAGRGMNDLTQYPVFPWILADYTSDTLDLTNPATFRDLSSPVGACGSRERRRVIQERYSGMKELGDVPSHYLTHYSSPAIALYFLIRLPPFTSLSILLQGGHFDHADRMFHSMQSSCRAVMTGIQDVRELIPELYYLPELCVNCNHVDYGRRQDKTPMDDLELPPWAHHDPYLFIYRMREALECPHVSAHLHEWIDLIFGYKQRGKDAIDALNVFSWHSYEDLDRNQEMSAADRQLLVDSLDNIGQTPIQLFRRPHQPREPHEWADALRLPSQVKLIPLRWGCARIARAMVVSEDHILVVTGSGSAAWLRLHLNLIAQQSTLQPPAVPAPPVAGEDTRPQRLEANEAAIGSGTEQGAAAFNTTAPRSLIPVVSPHQNLLQSPRLVDSGSFDVSAECERRLAPLPAGFIPNNSPYPDGSSTEDSTALLSYENEVFLALGGLFDDSVIIRALSGVRSDVRLCAHRGRVSYVVRSEDSHYLVTGAEDTTFAVWSCRFETTRPQLEVELLFTIHGHEDLPSAVDVSSLLDMVATASLDGILMVHSLSTGGLDRVLRHPDGAPIHRVLLQHNCYVPNILFMSHKDEIVHQYSVNGAPLRTFSPPGRITAWTTTASQCLLVACSPTSPRAARRTETHAGEARSAHGPLMLYLQSFSLEVRRAVPLPLDITVASISALPSSLQVVVAGTETGQLLLLRSVRA